MSVVYDEFYISTMREMDVCKKNIKKMQQAVNDMESKYNLMTAEFIEQFNNGVLEDREDYRVWHASYEGLRNWLKRLEEFKNTLQDLNTKYKG